MQNPGNRSRRILEKRCLEEKPVRYRGINSIINASARNKRYFAKFPAEEGGPFCGATPSPAADARLGPTDTCHMLHNQNHSQRHGGRASAWLCIIVAAAAACSPPPLWRRHQKLACALHPGQGKVIHGRRHRHSRLWLWVPPFAGRSCTDTNTG